MIRLLAFSSRKNELSMIERDARIQAAYLTDDRWEIFPTVRLEEVQRYLSDLDALDALCYDVTVRGSVSELEEIRKKYHKAYIILIAEVETSPLVYMKPAIMAAALLLRPFNSDSVKNALAEMVDVFDLEKKEDADVMVLEDEDGRVRIPCRSILYFESREKKIYACTAGKEYGFYDTLEQLAQRLPKEFLRVHRSFIVNCNKIGKTDLTEGLIYLEDGYAVPVSRTYRQTVRRLRQAGEIR